jgi:myo-inositol 2-dehydrogenase/D-chiro-inositol 1-dehydrogenase
VWEPNLTAAANEDHKGYHGLLGDFVRVVRGEATDAPNIADGVHAMKLLERVIASAT